MCLVPRQRLDRQPRVTILALAAVVLVLDATSKNWARSHLAGHPRHLVGPLWLREQFNAGFSFSLNRSGPLVTTVLTVVVAAAVVAVAWRARRGTPAVGFGLLIGGGGSNVVDRLLARPHRVTDFIAVGRLPVFNLADVAVTFGFIVLVVTTARGKKLLIR